MPFCRHPHPRYCNDVSIWPKFVKQITHRIHKDHLWHTALQRLAKLRWNQPQIKSLLVRVPIYSSEALSKRLRITMFAPRTNLRAPPHRIPSRTRPFTCRVGTHEV